jgi:hypothetical protein
VPFSDDEFVCTNSPAAQPSLGSSHDALFAPGDGGSLDFFDDILSQLSADLDLRGQSPMLRPIQPAGMA